MSHAFGITRRKLALGTGAAVLPLVHIRTAGAASKLKVAFGSNLTPGADAALQRLVEEWGAQTHTEIQTSFLSYTNNQVELTLEAEAQAKAGHDVIPLSYEAVTQYARLLEPVDDVVGRLLAKYGPVNETVVYVGKVEGHWAGTPNHYLSNLLCCAGRVDLFEQHVGLSPKETFPAGAEMGPGYDRWTWDAFLEAAAKCAKAGVPFGLPVSPCDDAMAWLGTVFRSFGAELVDAEGNVTVKSDAVRAVLEYAKRLAAYLPNDVYSWDNASNNRALVAGRTALILNPPSAWAQAVRDRPLVGSQCWHFPPPSGPKGRFINYFPQFLGIWRFSPNKGAAKELIEWLGQREQTERSCTADRGFDIPPFLSMSDFRIWQDEGPPQGTLSNYPIKPGHHVTATLPTYPAPLALVGRIYSSAVLPNMVAKAMRGEQSIPQAIAWAQRELEDLGREQ